MEPYKVKDMNLAEQGKNEIYWAETRMPVLRKIRERFEKEKPLQGITVGMCLHVTAETAVLVRTLKSGGAEVAITGCNPLSTQDSVAAALASEGHHVYSWRDETNEEYYQNLNIVLDYKPDITIDDGCDLVFTVHTKRQDCLENIKGGCEETTTGVHRIKAMEADGALKYPVMDVNDAYTKFMFDNRYGSGQSSLDGILRATNVLLAGKNFVVVGYGWCGRGVATHARGMGSNVTVVEVDSIKALEAVMDGFRVMSMAEAAKIGDVFLTVTGNKNVIRKEHMELMKDKAILANSGHFNVEISLPDLEALTKEKKQVRPNTVEYVLNNGKKLYFLAEGRLINLAAAEGHPPEVMDLSFANQALAVEHLVKNHKDLEPKVLKISIEQDKEIARLKLEAMDISTEKLTDEQKKYMADWKEGT